MAGPQGTRPSGQARQARDVMAFGQEVGRVLSDGRIVGRAEPFAKVFPSSRAVKRAVGLVAWAVLEDIALDARLDDRARLVAETNVRRIAANLGVSKNTVTHHLARLRDYGFVFHEEVRADASGRYEVSRYVLDPSACIERFTTTPPVAEAAPTPASARALTRRGEAPEASEQPCPRNGDTGRPPPCPTSWDTGATASQFTVSRVLGQKDKTVVEQQDNSKATAVAVAGRDNPETAGGRGGAQRGLADRLTALGVDAQLAAELVAEQPRQRVAAALAAAAQARVRNPAGWVVTALRDGWDLSGVLAEEQAVARRREQEQRDEAARAAARRVEDQQRAKADAWCQAVSAALDDRALATAISALSGPVSGVGRWSVPLVRARLLAWAVGVAQRTGHTSLADALRADLATGPQVSKDVCLEALPGPPPVRPGVGGDLSARIARCLPGCDVATRQL